MSTEVSRQARPVVIFRQAGNNARLGNTLVWIARAHAWCAQRGFAFYFPYARVNLAGLIDAASPLFDCPDELRSSALLRQAGGDEATLRFVDDALARILAIARDIESQAAADGSAQPVSVIPGALACVTSTRNVDWASSDLASAMRRHAACIVSEPHPFLAGLETAAETEASLLPPSRRARELMAAAGASFGVHIRQTDYRRWQGGRHFRDNDFYNDLIDGLLSLLPAGTTLHVAHDGEFEPRGSIRSSPAVRVSDGSTDVVLEDFVSFAMCDYLIGPTSTFTIQANRLGGLWAPKRRRLFRLDPDSSLSEILEEVRRAVGGKA